MALQRLLEETFPVRRGERPLTLLLMLHGFFSVGAFVTGRSARDALLLGSGGAGKLPWLILVAALVVAMVGSGYAPLTARVRRDKLAFWGALGSGVFYAAAFWAEQTRGTWVQPTLYVLVEVLGALSQLQFWTLVNEMFDARAAKRLYGFIGAGGTLANILIGMAGAAVAKSFGATALLLLCAGLSIGTALASRQAAMAGRQRLFARAASGRSQGPSSGQGLRRAMEHPHLRTIALLAGVTFITTTFVDYEFKLVAAQNLDRDRLAIFFGQLSAVVGVLALGLQLLGTNRLLRSAGVVGALAVLPSFLGVGTLAMALFPALWAASLAKGSDSLFRYSVNDASTQILYLPVPPRDRASSKALVDGVLKPMAVALAGLLLAGYQRWMGTDVRVLSMVALGMCAVWILLVVGVRSNYVQVLQENLTRGRRAATSSRTFLGEGGAQGALVRALESDSPREVLSALELLPAVADLTTDQRVEALLERPEPEIRVASLQYFARRQQLKVANAVFRCFDDSEPSVRAAAIEAFCVLGRDRAVRSVKSFLADPDSAVRGATITGLIRYGGLDGVVMASEALKGLIAHADSAMRARAAAVLGAIGVQNFYQPVLELMNDRDPLVRKRAVQTAGVLGSTEFILPLIYRTTASDTGPDALLALASYGPVVVPTLAKVLGNQLEELPIRRAVARVLGRIPSAETVQLIVRHLDAEDEELRTRLYKSLARIVRSHPLLVPAAAPVRNVLEREIERGWFVLGAAEALGLEHASSGTWTDYATPPGLLATAVREKLERIEQRLFVLLAVLYPDAGMEQLLAGIRRAPDGDPARRRSNAVELLDNLLDAKLKARLLPFLDEGSRSEKLRSADAPTKELPKSRTEGLRAFLRDESAWIRGCTIWLIGMEREVAFESELVVALSDGAGAVREAAVVALGRMFPERAPNLLSSALGDASATVRAQAERLVSRPIQVGAA